MRSYFLLISVLLVAPLGAADLEKARDAQDKAKLDQLAGALTADADKKPQDAAAQYKAAVAQLYRSEVALELKDKALARSAAETGIRLAEKAVALNGGSSEYHRVLGTLCGQVIPANLLSALKYGRCAMDEVNKALQLDSKSALNHLSHGVGSYYLPEQFGGGVNLAIKSFEKAIQLNPKFADAHLWLGIALRKANRNAEARKALEKAVQLNPARTWARQQLEKTPAK
jgi:tetratricopeptide (TPR) repeat protein